MLGNAMKIFRLDLFGFLRISGGKTVLVSAHDDGAGYGRTRTVMSSSM